jgi:hypothetical protein
LLYGFAKHDRPAAKEYYFWRICDELWNNDDLPEKLMVRHPWADRMIKNAIRNKYLAVGGSASSGKSHTMAAWGIVNFLSTFLAFVFMDRFGRRPLLMAGALLMGLSMATLGIVGTW